MLLGRKNVLAAKVEAEEGTPETLTGAECIRVYDLTWTPNVEMIDRPIGRSTIGKGRKLVGRSSAQMAFKVEFIGNHAAGAEPEWDPLVQACSFALTAGASDITYKPTSVSENVPSVTLGGWIDGIYRELAGARGNVQLMLPVGRMPYLQFTFTGAAWDVSDVVNPTARVRHLRAAALPGGSLYRGQRGHAHRPVVHKHAEHRGLEVRPIQGVRVSFLPDHHARSCHDL